MKKGWWELYGLAVCFFNVIVFVIFTGITVWNVMQISMPGFTLDGYSWSQYQSNEAFRESMVNRYCCTNVNCSYEPPEGDALTAAREVAYDQALVAESRSGFQNALQNLIILIINCLLFVVHWRIASRARLHTEH